MQTTIKQVVNIELDQEIDNLITTTQDSVISSINYKVAVLMDQHIKNHIQDQVNKIISQNETLILNTLKQEITSLEKTIEESVLKEITSNVVNKKSFIQKIFS